MVKDLNQLLVISGFTLIILGSLLLIVARIQEREPFQMRLLLPIEKQMIGSILIFGGLATLGTYFLYPKF